LDSGYSFLANKRDERYTLSEFARHTILDRLLAPTTSATAKKAKGKKTVAAPEKDLFG
jgi:hypothetical protein